MTACRSPALASPSPSATQWRSNWLRLPLPIRMAEPNPLNRTFRWMSTRGHVGSFTVEKREAISALVDMVKESLPDGDHHKISVKVRNEGGDVVLHVALNFDVVKENRSSGGATPSPDRHV